MIGIAMAGGVLDSLMNPHGRPYGRPRPPRKRRVSLRELMAAQSRRRNRPPKRTKKRKRKVQRKRAR